MKRIALSAAVFPTDASNGRSENAPIDVTAAASDNYSYSFAMGLVDPVISITSALPLSVTCAD